MATIAVYPQDVTGEPTVINCPDGSVFYWARRIHQLCAPPLLQFVAEVQSLPYLGYIVQPDDAAFGVMAMARTSEQFARSQVL